MFNVKLIKVEARLYGFVKQIYLNLNFVEAVSPDFEDLTCRPVTIVRMISGKKYCVLMEYDDFIDYLCKLSVLLSGGDSE